MSVFYLFRAEQQSSHINTTPIVIRIVGFFFFLFPPSSARAFFSTFPTTLMCKRMASLPELPHVTIHDLRTPDRQDTAVNAQFCIPDRTMHDQTVDEIDAVTAMLKNLEQERTTFTTRDRPSDLIANLEKDAILRTHLVKLRNKLNTLQWRSFASNKSLFSLDPMVVDRLLDIQRETATATGALAAVGAGISISTLYSAARGDMWPFFVSWWLFVISLATTSALGFTSSGSSAVSNNDLLETDTKDQQGNSLETPSTKGWLLRRLSVVAVLISLLSVVGGWAALAAAVGTYSVTEDLHGDGPKVTNGPDLGEEGIRVYSKWVLYGVIITLACAMVGGYIWRLRLFSRAWRKVALASTTFEL